MFHRQGKTRQTMVRNLPVERWTETESGCVFDSGPVMAGAVPYVYRICKTHKFYKHQLHVYDSFLRDQGKLDKFSFIKEERHSSFERPSYLPKII